MKWYSTNRRAPQVSLKEAVLNGLAPDNGLYMPERIPQLSNAFLAKLSNQSFHEIAFQIAASFFEDEITANDLRGIIERALNFDAPIVKLDDKLYALELFHGPTLAFKDFGARFMAELLGYFERDSKQELTILVATSGDTGSAVAHGFYKVPNINVVILYPSGKVSHIQEQQLTTLGENITALEVKGTFDDCQRMVKEAFLDEGLRRVKRLSSANSINIARLIPQAFYYAWAVAQLPKDASNIFSVPSGNFGNLTAGLIAKRMGMPISKFVASTNVNDVVPEYLKTGLFSPRPSVSTISNAMDVGNPSNFSRMQELYPELDKITSDIAGYKFTDKETEDALREIYSNYQYVADPHGAVGYLGSEAARKDNRDSSFIFLETAHPAKFLDTTSFYETVEVPIPDRLKACLGKKKVSTVVSPKTEDLIAHLRN